MGSKTRDSDAIIKAAATICTFENIKKYNFFLTDKPRMVTLEGGQGFLPDKNLESIKDSIRQAVNDGHRMFKEEYGIVDDVINVSVSFDKLHNRAYSSENSMAGPLLATAVRVLTGKESNSFQGWQASCDARLFSRKFSDVVTFGAGNLENAHQIDEYVKIDDLMNAAAGVTLAILTSRSE